VSLKQLLKSVWLYSWVLIVPLAILASFTDLLLLGGIRLFLSLISDSWKSFLNFVWLKDLQVSHWILIMITIISTRYLFITLRARSEERLSHKLESHLRAWWIRVVKDLHPMQFHKPGIDSILHNANLSVSAMPKGCKVVTQSIQAVSQLLFFVPVLFFLSWQLTLVLLFIFTPIVLYLQRSIKKAGKDVENYSLFSGDYDSHVWRWSALRKCWNNRAELSKYSSLLFKKIRNLKDSSTEIGVRDVTITQSIETLSILAMSLVLAICAFLINNGSMDAFQIILFCAALFICYKPLKECSQLFSYLRDLRRSYAGLKNLENMERMARFFQEKDEDCIRIENMAFKYGDYEPWVFHSLSNVLRLNRPIILQGENGTGKTTMLRILSGLEIPQEGKVFIPPKAQFGTFYLSQRLFLPPIHWLEEAVKAREWSTAIRSFFEILGLQTLLKKNGHSNGELQRLGLAWAIVSGMPFLFLDEPFAFVSQDMREPVFKAFWEATAETGQWWMMATHIPLSQTYQDKVVFWKL
jgi:ABC-type multidrug transport system fused ATPase/permease subunit